MDASWVEKWRGARIFVLGDVMLDRFVQGRVERISPEAPIPVLHFQSEKVMLGGAANVARNIVALGGEAILVGVVGEDAEGDLIAGPLSKVERIDARLIRLPGHPTIVKTRFVSGGQQIMRLDVESRLHLDTATTDALCAHFVDVADRVDAVVLSDYAKGVLTPEVLRSIIALAQARGAPVIVDPKSRDMRRYKGATVLTPNALEAALIASAACANDAEAEAAAKYVHAAAQVESVVLTRGAHGMTVWAPAEARPLTHIPTVASEVFDVSGAGDTVVATLSLALASGAGVTMAAKIANVAAGIAVGKRGTAVVQGRELATALGGARDLADPKIIDDATAVAMVADWQAHGLKVGFTNGCFDLLHPGHVQLLKKARAACDRLIVALNTDASVRRLKGETRPVQNEQARTIVMASIDSVDLVTLFDEDTPLRLIELLKPDYLIKGADYSIATVVGSDFVASYGGKVVLVPLEAGHSTTSMIARANVKGAVVEGAK